MQSPVATQLRPALPEVGLREITKLLHQDAISKKGTDDANLYGGEFDDSTFRLIQMSPIPDLKIGYVYTQNGPDSKYTLNETCEFSTLEHFSILNQDGSIEDSSNQAGFKIQLHPGQSEMKLFIEEKDGAKLQVVGHLELRQKSRQELKAET